jgi:hypothetical protein
MTIRAPALCAPQWQSFLQLLGQEWAASQSSKALHQQMLRRGRALADLHPLPAVTGLLPLEQAMNEVWNALQWGWVRLHDQGNALHLVHHGAPLVDAFGVGSVDWTVGLLEGVYQRWFEQAGANGLRLRALSHGVSPLAHEFTLSADPGSSGDPLATAQPTPAANPGA